MCCKYLTIRLSYVVGARRMLMKRNVTRHANQLREGCVVNDWVERGMRKSEPETKRLSIG
jgi:hypothetical protein